MNHKPLVEPYNSLLFDEPNLKRAGAIIKHRHELINVSRHSIFFPISEVYLTIGACGADTSIRSIVAFSESAMSA